MNRFVGGNRLALLCSGDEYFPALLDAIDGAQKEIWLETYLYADDRIGRLVSAALIRAVRRGVVVRVLVDGWGARHFLTPALEGDLLRGGVALLKYRPGDRALAVPLAPAAAAAPQAVPRRRQGRVRRRDQRDRRHEHAAAKPPRVDFAVRVEGPLLPHIVYTMKRVRAISELVQLQGTDVPLFPDVHGGDRVGTQTAKFLIRDNLRHRRDIEHAYLAAIRIAKDEILIASSYFFPGIRFRHALIAAAGRGVRVTLILQARVEYVLLHYAARALYGQLLAAGIAIEEYHRSFLHAKVAVVDGKWATVGSSNIDPYSLLMAREANVVVRDPAFAGRLREELLRMVRDGARRVGQRRWSRRPPLYKAANWIAYGVVRVAMGLLGYGGNEWFRVGRRKRKADRIGPPSGRPRPSDIDPVSDA